MRTGTCRSGRSQTSEGRRDRFHSRRPMVYYALQKNLRTVFADLFLCTFRKYVCSPVSPETPSYGRSHCTCIQISAFFNPSGLPKAGHHYISWKDESLQGIEGSARVPITVQGGNRDIKVYGNPSEVLPAAG